MDYKNAFASLLFDQLNGQIEQEQLTQMIEKPKYEGLGDLAFPCFSLAKLFRQSPQTIAHTLAQSTKLSSSSFEKIEAVNGYVNAFINKKEMSSEVIKEIISKKDTYGDCMIGGKHPVAIDFSSPNIAKPFSMGHLRSTVIGNALALIYEKCGYHTIRINHLGDWGTQFGKLIVAYRLWGDEQKVKENPIKELLTLYIRFHEEAEQDPSLEDLGRQWFKKLEDGDKDALALWKWFREESLKEFTKVYELLGVSFDSTHGEAFYNDKMDRIVQLLEEQGLLQESEGAQIVKLQEDVPPCLIKKKDGTTLYATRDLAAALYRYETYKFVKTLYVVGNEQSLHFKQLFGVLEKMGYSWHEGLTHVPFGMMLKDGKKMSTRKGKIVLLEEVLHDAMKLAEKNIAEKNPSLEEKEKVARQVGTGAVVFHDLKNYRQNDLEFSLEDMLKFEGETGPYVQYTHARTASLLRKGHFLENKNKCEITDDEAWPIITSLSEFPAIIKRALEGNDPSQIARYVLDLSKAFNKYYGSVRILEDPEKKQARLTLVNSVQIVLKEGLRLLGIQAPQSM